MGCLFLFQTVIIREFQEFSEELVLPGTRHQGLLGQDDKI